MTTKFRAPRTFAIIALLGATAATSLSAQTTRPADGSEVLTTVYGNLPPMAAMNEGPRITGIISARQGQRLQVTSDDGSNTIVTLHPETEIRTRGGFLGIGNKTFDQSALINGLPVIVKTAQYGDGLVASEVRFNSDDRQIAAMIRGGTSQRFAEHGAAIEQNTVGITQNAAATEALRGRLGDIDKYNLKSTTNVYFDTGKSALTPGARAELCAAAQEANANENSLMLVLGYTDSTGSQEVNQTLSEKRASAVVNHLQQVCKWKPYRMLTPTGMATADPAADNTTAAGRAQNRRVSVNVLVSKALDEQ
ncbi:MAG: cell envelope biogenesis protein OmpA [Alphaproteobacteria bacterium HGW-Alphaproteobacteria-7]|nr:MAG: cell envelope biogenesis protein OmpA [Alphaproteobacteria bacterium HGW-Alphaproteobacteria-7]